MENSAKIVTFFGLLRMALLIHHLYKASGVNYTCRTQAALRCFISIILYLYAVPFYFLKLFF